MQLAGQWLHSSVISRGAHIFVPPMPVEELRLQPPGASLRIRCPPRVTGSVSHVSDRASRRSGPAGKALTMLLFGAAGATGPATRSRGVATQWSARGRRALLNDFARQCNPGV